MEQSQNTLSPSPQQTTVGNSTDKGSAPNVHSMTEQPNTQSSAAPIFSSQNMVTLPPVGELSGKSEPLPAITIKEISQAYERLTALKSKANSLDNYRSNPPDQQQCLLFVLMFLVLGPFALCCIPCMMNQGGGDELKTAMIGVLEQINELRKQFGSDPSWPQVEESIKLKDSIFKPVGLVDRSVLEGSL